MPENAATLGLVVDSTGARVANDALKKLTVTGGQAERQTESLSTVSRRLSESQAQVGRSASESRARIQALREEHDKLEGILQREAAARASGLSASARQVEAARTEVKSEEQLYQAKLRSMEVE